jgi:HEAT repeat protein
MPGGHAEEKVLICIWYLADVSHGAGTSKRSGRSYEIAVSLVTGTAEKVCLNAPLTIEITTLDINQLQQTCSELVESIRRNRNDVSKVLDAAKALLVIQQPLVVPFLEEAFKANHAVDGLVITGLEQIGNEAAVKVLIPMLDNPDPQDSNSQQARGALLRIQQRTTDPAILELLRTALASVKN